MALNFVGVQLLKDVVLPYLPFVCFYQLYQFYHMAIFFQELPPIFRSFCSNTSNDRPIYFLPLRYRPLDNIFFLICYQQYSKQLSPQSAHFDMMQIYIYGSELVRMAIYIINTMSNTTQMSINQLLPILKQLNEAQNAKVLERIVEEGYRDNNLTQLFLKTINNSPDVWTSSTMDANISVIMENCSIILNRCLVKQFSDDNFNAPFETNVKLFFNILVNWGLPFSIKKRLINAFQAFLEKWEKEIHSFFEYLLETLIKLMNFNATKLNTSKEFKKIIYCSSISQEFQIHLRVPQHTQQIYHTIIFLAQGLFAELQKKPVAYQEKMINSLKLVHHQIFKQEYIERYFNIFKHLFLFWENFNFEGLDVPLKLKPVFRQIAKWNAFPHQIEMIMNYKAQTFQQGEKIFNYFLPTQEVNSRDLIELKINAITVFNQISIISQILLHNQFDKTCLYASLSILSDSILHSLKFALQYDRCLLEQNQELIVKMLQNFSLYIENYQLSQQIYQDIILDIFFPLIVTGLKECEQSLSTSDDAHQLLETFNDCCEGQKFHEVLPYACKCIELIADSSTIAQQFIKNCIFYSLTRRFKLADIDSQKYQYFELAPSMFILNLLSYTQLLKIQEKTIINLLFTKEIFYSLSDYEKIYFYLYLSYNWTQIYDGDEYKAQFFFEHIRQLSNGPLFIFALDFMNNTCQYYFHEQTIVHLAKKLKKINEGQNNLLFQIISKTISSNLQQMSGENVIKIAKMLSSSALTQLAQTKNQDHSKFGLVTKLHICRQISKNHDYIKDKQELIKILYRLVNQVSQFSKIFVEDQVMWIAGELLEATKQIPQNFLELLMDINSSFMNSEYSGMCYFSFFGQCIQLLNQYEYQTVKQYITKLYDTIIEGFAYLTHFPQEIVNEQFQTFASHEILLQNIFFFYGDRLTKNLIVQTKSLCNKILTDIIPQAYCKQYILQIRTYNLILLCEILDGKKYDIQSIYQLVEKSQYCNSYDFSLLIFLLNKIRPQLSENQYFKLSVIVLLVVKASQKGKKKKNGRLAFEQIKKQNNIFNYVNKTIPIEQTTLEEARAFFIDYQKENPQSKERVCRQLLQTQLSAQLQKVFNKKLSPIQSFNISLNEMEGQMSENQLQESKNASLFQQVTAKRKIVHIIKDRVPSQLIQSYQAPKTTKRLFKTESTLQNEQLEKREKRQKVDETLIIPEPQKSKKEIMMQKIVKKANRY